MGDISKNNYLNQSEFGFLSHGYNGDNCTIIKTVELNEKIVDKLEDLRVTILIIIIENFIFQNIQSQLRSRMLSFYSKHDL